MKNAIRSTQALWKTGKLHRKLMIRLRLFFCAALFSAIALFIDILFRGLPVLASCFFLLAGFLFGYLLLSKALPIRWHETEEVITVGRFDMVGFFILALYLLVRFVGPSYISGWSSNAFFVSGYTLAGFLGMVLGRIFGILESIHILSTSDHIPRL